MMVNIVTFSIAEYHLSADNRPNLCFDLDFLVAL